MAFQEGITAVELVNEVGCAHPRFALAVIENIVQVHRNVIKTLTSILSKNLSKNHGRH